MSSLRVRQNLCSSASRRAPTRVRIFLSYSHRDERLREQLDKHLSPLRRSALIDAWHDRRIMPGAEIGAEIDQNLTTADVVLLLISPDFIDSDYCYQTEMRIALRRHAKGLAKVIPVILRPVDWTTTPLGGLLATPKDAKPVISWHRRDDALLDVARSVRLAVEDLAARLPRAKSRIQRSSVAKHSPRSTGHSDTSPQRSKKRGSDD